MTFYFFNYPFNLYLSSDKIFSVTELSVLPVLSKNSLIFSFINEIFDKIRSYF